MDSAEPYRATRLWNEVIEAFQSGMPVKKHRRRMHTYNNCFTASEAVTWLQCYLMNNPNFGPHVTRQQTVNLLQKFLKCHVIESLLIRSKRKEFSDDSHLYRLSPVTPMSSKPSALCLIQSPSFGVRNRKNESTKRGICRTNSVPDIQKENLPECHIVERKLSPNEVKVVWERVTLSRLEKLLTFASIDDIVDEKIINGHVIKHNVNRLSKTGVVCLVDKTDDIPSWVISAMKCLANWPNASGSGSCLPNYPGFEKDVFKVVRDFFINPQVPLLPPSLSQSLLKIFCHFTQNSLDVRTLKTNPVPSELNYSSKAPESSSSVKTSTPMCNNESSASNQRDSNNSLKDISHGTLLLDDPEVMWEYSSAIFYETDFATTDPVTRVISDQRSRSSSYASSVGSIESVSTISVCSQSHQTNVLNNDTPRTKSPLKAWTSNLYLQDEIRSPHRTEQEFLHHEALGFSSKTTREPIMNRSHSLTQQPFECKENVYLCEINDLDTSNLSAKTVIEVDAESIIHHSLQNVYLSSSAICSRNTSSQSSNQTPQMYINQSGKQEIVYSQELKLAFQLILLFLPSANRRQLHLLLRLLTKVLKNGKFVLNVKMSMREYLLETFLPSIIQSEQNSRILLQMAAFLLDNCEILFQPPNGLKEEVADLSRSCYGRIKYSVDDTCLLSYCEMVSKQQYDEDRISASTEALKSLLNSILTDPSITGKERKRKMKQFRDIHPEVYYLQFPEKQEYRPKPKQTLLSKLVNLRM